MVRSVPEGLPACSSITTLDVFAVFGCSHCVQSEESVCGGHILPYLSRFSLPGLGRDRLFNRSEKVVQINSAKKPVAICWIAVHGNLTAFGPFAQCVLDDAQDFGRFGSLHVFGQLRRHLRPPVAGCSSLAKSARPR